MYIPYFYVCCVCVCVCVFVCVCVCVDVLYMEVCMLFVSVCMPSLFASRGPGSVRMYFLVMYISLLSPVL